MESNRVQFCVRFAFFPTVLLFLLDKHTITTVAIIFFVCSASLSLLLGTLLTPSLSFVQLLCCLHQHPPPRPFLWFRSHLRASIPLIKGKAKQRSRRRRRRRSQSTSAPHPLFDLSVCCLRGCFHHSLHDLCARARAFSTLSSNTNNQQPTTNNQQPTTTKNKNQEERNAGKEQQQRDMSSLAERRAAKKGAMGGKLKLPGVDSRREA